MNGLLQVIGLMLALGGFGVDENKKALDADDVLEYAVPDADVVIHADVAAVAPRNYDALIALRDDAAVKSSPDALALVKKLRTNLEGVRGMAKSVTGVDLVDDVRAVTVFLDLVPGALPTRMAVARGTFPSDVVVKLAKIAGGTTGTIDGRTTLEMGEMFIGTTEDGALIAGPKDWVEPRIDDDWKPAKRAKGGNAAMIAKLVDEKPFLLVASQIDEADTEGLAKDLGPGFLADLATSHELAVLALHHDGVVFQWKDRTKEHLERVELAAEGVIELMRAGHMAPRGVVKLLVAALDSYAGMTSELDELIAHKDELTALVDAFSGSGEFKAKTKRDAKKRTFTVRATGEKLSDVVPFAAIVPLVVIWLVSDGAGADR
jgi:hypothetical protein